METGRELYRDSHDYDGEWELLCPATIALVATLVGTSVGIGTTGFELANQPGAPKPAPPPTPAQISTLQNSEKASISQQAPNVLSQTSGLVTPDYVAQISQLLAGTGGQTGSTGAARDVVSQLFGLSPGAITNGGASGGGTGTFTPTSSAASNANTENNNSPTNLSDFVNRFIYAGGG
jgi:hypothetical protein